MTKKQLQKHVAATVAEMAPLFAALDTTHGADRAAVMAKLETLSRRLDQLEWRIACGIGVTRV